MPVSRLLQLKLPSSRVSLALPFVLTAVTACTVKSSEEPTAAPQQTEGEATPVIVSNPPPPQPAAVEDTNRDPRTDAPTTAPATTTIDPPRPVIMRNPPSPRVDREPTTTDSTLKVKAPEVTVKPKDTATEYPTAPTTSGHVRVRKDGSCWWSATPKCPPKTACNPPPPKRVQCADAKGPATDQRSTAPARTNAK